MERTSFVLKPVAPFRLDLTAWALRRRVENIVDRWDGSSYRRVLIVHQHPVDVEVVQKGPAGAPLLHITISGNKISSDTQKVVASVLTRMLGTVEDLTEFYRFAERRPKLDALVRRFRGVKPPRFPTIFEAMVNAFACQQLSLTVGIYFLNRLAEAFGPPGPKQRIAVHGFPAPENLSALETDALRSLGFSRQKASAIIGLAAAVFRKQLNLDELESLESEEAFARLRELRGVGRWSAEYVLLRGLGRLHVFPGDDVGARNNLQRWLALAQPLDYERVRQIVAPWKPFGGLIYFHLLLERLAEAGFLNPWENDGIR